VRSCSITRRGLAALPMGGGSRKAVARLWTALVMLPQSISRLCVPSRGLQPARFLAVACVATGGGPGL